MKPKTVNESGSVKVILDDTITKPFCKHGPTLLFETTSKKFFACSACRDRADCPFYEEYTGEPNTEVEQKIRNKALNLLSFDEFQGSNVNDRFYCMKCHTVYLRSQPRTHSNSCLSFESIPFPTVLAKPSEFLPPKSYDKTEAQYFFSSDTLKFFVRLFRQLSINKVLCIGAPAMHDELLSNGIKSFLLDIDERLVSFYPSDKFSLYNMFNHHFFDINNASTHPRTEYLNFLKDSKQSDSLCIFTDPPFGCLTEPLSDSLRKVQNDYRSVNAGTLKVVPIILVFPYFMENYVRKVMPELAMSDYKVNYSNHDKYNEQSNARKDLGSPVRFFTNILQKLIKLPKDQYRFCNICDRFVSKTNIHCRLCGVCPSKNGATYKHCKICHLCVKPNYVHCTKCNKCTQKPSHNCVEYKKFLTCQICYNKGHPEINCTLLKRLRRKSAGKKGQNKKNCLICCTDGHTHFTCSERETFLEQVRLESNKI